MYKCIGFVVILLFLPVVVSIAYAGFDEGEAAYERGDYATDYEDFKALAEQGEQQHNSISD